MHGDGGSPLGGFLDVRGMWVQFYFMHRLVLNHFVHDDNVRKHLVLPGCNAKNVPDVKDGIRWINSKGERMCHLYWARQFKKLLVDKAMLQNKNDTKAAEALLEGMPKMTESIAATVLVGLRAVFHKRFPYGTEIYHKLTAQITGALMRK